MGTSEFEEIASVQARQILEVAGRDVTLEELKARYLNGWSSVPVLLTIAIQSTRPEVLHELARFSTELGGYGKRLAKAVANNTYTLGDTIDMLVHANSNRDVRNNSILGNAAGNPRTWDSTLKFLVMIFSEEGKAVKKVRRQLNPSNLDDDTSFSWIGTRAQRSLDERRATRSMRA